MRPTWQRLAVVAACFAVIVIFLARGGERPGAETASETADDVVHIPLPPPPPAKPPSELARGVYLVETPELRVVLELLHGRRFRFLSSRGAVQRTAEGTWSITGRRLTMAYTHLDGKPVEGEPVVAVNTWTGRAVELKDTPFGPVQLVKQTMIREK